MAVRSLPKAVAGVVPAKKASALAQTRALIHKAFPKDESFVEIDEDSIKESRAHLPTGSIVMDYLIGGRINRFGVRPCPGLPRKCIINLYGQESSGKTTFALTAAAMTCAGGGSVGYIDWENSIDVSYSKALGVPLDNPDLFALYQPESLEKGISILWTMAKAGVDLIVIDSVGAGVPQSTLGQTVVEKGEMGRIGTNAAQWSKLLPELKNIINQTGSCVIGISQLRKKIGGMTGFGGEDTHAQGGEAWKFYSEVRMGLKKIHTEKGKDYNSLTHKVEDATVGQTVKCRIDKCKVSASQGRTADFYIRFGDGIDDMRSIIEIAAAHGVIKKVSSWFSFERPDGTIIKKAGLEAFKAAVKETDGVWDELYTAAIKVMSEKPGSFVEVIEQEDDFSDLNEIMFEPKPVVEEE